MSVAQASAPPALAARRISKRFGATRALDGASVTIAPGEIHGLLGANGSGKSTLIKVLAGVHAPDPGGELEIRGRPVTLPLAPAETHALGLAFVHQELALVPELSVTENLRLGELARRRGWFLSRRHEHEHAERALARGGLELDPRRPVGELEPPARAMIAVIRAVEDLRGRSGVLVLDEPSVFLPQPENQRLFHLARGVVAGGGSVLFVSHDLNEVAGVADRVTVLRDGRALATVDPRSTDRAALVELIVGRGSEPAEKPALADRIAARVTGLHGKLVRDAALEIRAGEILGLTGLAGSGFGEVPYLLFGATPGRGRLELGGATLEVERLTPTRAVKAGIALVPADRARDGGIDELSAADNITVAALGRYARRHGLGLDLGRLRADARRLLAAHHVLPPDPDLAFGALSGGNQQKAMLAKWLHTGAALLLLDEPVQGVDVGARREIVALMRRAVADGGAAICASSDHDQLAETCDRVLVFSAGAVAYVLSGADMTGRQIAEACYWSRSSRLDLAAGGSA